MLEDKIKKILMGMVMAGSVYLSGCAPTLQVVSKLAGPNGLVSTGYNCCSTLSCNSKGYDGCISDGEVAENGVLYEKCHCYDNYTPSTSSNSNSDRGGYDRDRGTQSRDKGGCRVESRGPHR